MGPDETGSNREPVNATLALVREAAGQHRHIADEWSRVAPDDITAIGFAQMSKALCSLLRSNAALLENLVGLIEAESNVRRNSQCDHQARDSSI